MRPMTVSSNSAMIGGPCSISVAVTNSVKPEMSASTSAPSSRSCLMPWRHRNPRSVKAVTADNGRLTRVLLDVQ